MTTLEKIDIPVKSTKKPKRRNKKELFEILDRHGAKSKEFYEYLKPFIISVIGRFLNPHLEMDETLIQDCYMAVIRGFCGGYTYRLSEWVYVPAYFDRTKCKSPINFIITLIRGPVSLRNYHGLKHFYELDNSEEFFNNIKDKPVEMEAFQYDFQNFEFNSAMQEHIREVFEFRPINNVVYDFVSWDSFSKQEDEYKPVNYHLSGVSND